MSNVSDVAKNFHQFIGDGVAVVDFWAPWCGPCRMLAPILDEVAAKVTAVKFGKVNVDESPELAKRYQVMSIPNVCIIKNGQLVDRVIGLCDAEELQSAVQNTCNRRKKRVRRVPAFLLRLSRLSANGQAVRVLLLQS